MYHTFSHNNYAIGYQKFGTLKPAAVLIHGFREDGTVFRNQYEFLKEKFTVIVPDLPGTGKSAYNTNLQSIEDFAEIIALILEEEDVDKCFMLGHSMGGYIALAFAEKYPEHLLGLGLVHSTAFADDDEKKAIRKRAIDIMEQDGALIFFRTATENLFSETFVSRHPEIIDELMERGKSIETKALQQYYGIMMNRKDRTDVLKNISIPVLFLIGEKDKAVLLNNILQQVSLPSMSYIKILPNAAHMGFLEEPEVSNQAIFEFLSA